MDDSRIGGEEQVGLYSLRKDEGQVLSPRKSKQMVIERASTHLERLPPWSSHRFRIDKIRVPRHCLIASGIPRSARVALEAEILDQLAFIEHIAEILEIAFHLMLIGEEVTEVDGPK